jgi:chemotaxis protein histidine kinase CheA
LKDGFEVDSIEFDRREYTIEVVSIDFIIDYLTELCSEYDKREVYSVDSKDKVLEKFIEIKEAYAFKRVIFCLDKEEDKEELTVVIVRLKDQV